MLTGDNEGTARSIAQKFGIDKYYANTLPDKKVHRVKQLREIYKKLLW